MRKKGRKILIAVLLVLSTVFLIFLLTVQLTSFLIPDLSTAGYVKVMPAVRIANNTGILTLKSGCKELTMSISPWQAESIELGIKGKRGVRPNTHDLLSSILDDYGIRVLMVKITSIKNGIYYAKLIVRQGNKILGLDSRPSDAVAIAVRTKADIFSNERLLRDVC